MRIGVDLGGTKIEALAIDRDGNDLARQRIPTPSGDYDATIRAVVHLVAGIERHRRRTARVGVGIPGTISPATGLVKNANSVCLIGKPLQRDLSAALQRDIRVANDANCFAVSEATDGAARGATIVFGVILGTGVGGGIVVRGEALVGGNTIAGEWGHNPLPLPNEAERPGPTCYCGRHGCIETFLSGPGLTRDHAARTGETLDPASLDHRATGGDRAAEDSLVRYEDRLARALAGVINIVDPEVIVLGGGLSQLSRLYANVPKIWEPYVFSDRVDTRLVPPRHGDSSGVRGAAWLWPAGEDRRT